MASPRRSATRTQYQHLATRIDLDTEYTSVQGEMQRLAEKQSLSTAEQTRYAMLATRNQEILDAYDKLADREAWEADVKASTYREHDGVPSGIRDSLDARGGAVRDALTDVQALALRSLEAHSSAFTARALDVQELAIRHDAAWASYVEACSRPAYLSGFGKVLAHGGDRAALFMDDEERQAMHAMYHARALAEGATTTGGFAVPVVLDPSIIITDQESENVMLQTCRVENVTSNTWKGISSAGAVWSFDAEAAEVSDDSTTIAQPSVTVFMARGFIPYSIEIEQDWPGFQSEMARLLATGYDELLLDKLTRGSGTGEPMGLLTALDANTNDEVTSTTDGAFGQEDIYKVWKALPQKARRRAAWMMSIDAMDKVRQFGTQTNPHAYTVNLPAGAIDSIMARPVFENPYFPDVTSTTGAENRLVVGSFDAYVIAKRSGLAVEVVPHLLNTANNRPMGQRGMFAFARVGGNVVDPLAFRLLQNQ